MTNEINRKENNQPKTYPLSPSEVVFKLLEGLKPRARNILIKRFGLDGQPRQTLEEIGKQYGITRERVRQIQNAALREIVKSGKIGEIKVLEEELKSLLQEHGHIMEHQHLMENFLKRIGDSKFHKNQAEFILTLSPHFEEISEGKTNKYGWKLKGAPADVPEKVVKAFCDILEKERKPLPEDHALTVVLNHDEVKNLHDKAKTRKAILSYLNLSKKVLKNPFNEWGLASWAEVAPRSMRDRAYLVLKKAGKPLHFREIAALINKMGFLKKPANTQTVHNELIKDKRFVLVGRGIYALVEWGYRPGTTAEIVETVLREAKGALHRDEIINRVLKQRKVKRNTIILALQNKEKFERVGEGMYKLVQKS